MFGLPLVPEKGRGRPSHEWTRENSNKINLLFACGRKPIEVARVLGISKPTFYKYYFNEIANAGYAPLMMRARQLERLNDAAEGGNVAAEKALAAMIQSERVAVTAERVTARGGEKSASKGPPIGKKQEALQAAESMAGRYGTREPPPGLLN